MIQRTIHGAIIVGMFGAFLLGHYFGSHDCPEPARTNFDPPRITKDSIVLRHYE